jgi:hypothetical protein
VYTALLTQNGGGSAEGLNSGPVTKGVTYEISGIDGDFSNVGAPNNNDDTFFVAINNEIPNSYGTSTLKFDTGAPVATVLENTLGYLPIFTKNDIGKFSCVLQSADFFKTFVQTGGFTSLGEYRFTSEGNNLISIQTFQSLINSDNILNYAPIEIRVYN